MRHVEIRQGPRRRSNTLAELRAARAPTDGLPELSAFALARLLIVLLELERFEDALSFEHTLETSQRPLERFVSADFYACHGMYSVYYTVQV